MGGKRIDRTGAAPGQRRWCSSNSICFPSDRAGEHRAGAQAGA